MPRPWILHRNCNHENTPYERWKCRAKVRHANCDHRQDPTGWKACERVEPDAE